MRRIAYANYLQVGCYYLFALEMEDHSHGRSLADPQLRLSLLCSQGSLRTVSEYLEARDAPELHPGGDVVGLRGRAKLKGGLSSLKVTNRPAVKTGPRSASLDPEILPLSSTTTTGTAMG